MLQIYRFLGNSWECKKIGRKKNILLENLFVPTCYLVSHVNNFRCFVRYTLCSYTRSAVRNIMVQSKYIRSEMRKKCGKSSEYWIPQTNSLYYSEQQCYTNEHCTVDCKNILCVISENLTRFNKESLHFVKSLELTSTEPYIYSVLYR